jgi:hypothetical protein
MAQGDVIRERFRCSCLAPAGEWCLASAVAGLLVWGIIHSSLGHRREALILAALPLVWATGWSLRRGCTAWTFTSDGWLVREEGLLTLRRQVFVLRSARTIETAIPLVGRLLDVGHVTFQATDRSDQIHRHEVTWMTRHRRFCQLIEARGSLPLLDRVPWWQRLGGSLAGLTMMAEHDLEQALPLLAPDPVRSNSSLVEDYDRFMAFCHQVLRAGRGGGKWPPDRIPPEVLGTWFTLLSRARVVVSGSNPAGWRLGNGIESLDDIQRRISRETFGPAVRRTGSRPRGFS